MIRELNEFVGAPVFLRVKLLHLSNPWKVTLYLNLCYVIFKDYSNVLDERSRSTLNKRSVGC